MYLYVQIRLGTRKCWFFRRGKKRAVTGEKSLEIRERTDNKLKPHMVSTPRYEPEPH